MASLHLGAALVGTVVAAAVAAAVFTIRAVVWWARVVEPWLFAPRGPAPVARPPAPVNDGRHLAFAEALAAVASRYLADCEEESRR